jgi:hypothetical protein
VLGEGRSWRSSRPSCSPTTSSAGAPAAHAHLEIYTGLPQLHGHWVREGFDDSDFVRGGSDRLKEALVVRGDEDAVVRRVREHPGRRASHVCVQVLGRRRSTSTARAGDGWLPP